jgi:hypothetical protein
MEKQWLKSKEVMKTLKIRACDVMHLRGAGKLKFTKKGNAFLYAAESVALIQNKVSIIHLTFSFLLLGVRSFLWLPLFFQFFVPMLILHL